MDKDFCLISIKNQKRLSFLNVMKHIQNAHKENRKDQNGIFISKYGEFVFDEFVFKEFFI